MPRDDILDDFDLENKEDEEDNNQNNAEHDNDDKKKKSKNRKERRRRTNDEDATSEVFGRKLLRHTEAIMESMRISREGSGKPMKTRLRRRSVSND